MPTSAPAQAPEPVPAPEPTPVAASAEPVAEQPGGPRGGLSLVDVRRLWPDILEQTKNRRRLAWMVLSQHAHVVDVDATRLTVGFANSGARDSFVNGGCDEILRQAAIDVVGMDWRVESIVDPSGAAAAQPVVQKSSTDPAAMPAPAPDAPDAPPAWVTGGAAPEQSSAPEAPTPAAPPPVSAAPAREALEAARAGGGAPESVEPVRSADDDVDPDDPDAESAALDTESLLSQTLGARLIEEIKHD
jgi:DNA polymerase-3 subunit gamma/tau